jgi:hypothetical protein
MVVLWVRAKASRRSGRRGICIARMRSRWPRHGEDRDRSDRKERSAHFIRTFAA